MKKLFCLQCVMFCLVFAVTTAQGWDVILDDTAVTGLDDTVATGKQSNKISMATKGKGVGLVVCSVPGQRTRRIGTAWLYKQDVLATNAHVSMGVTKFLNLCKEKNLGQCVPYYLPNGSKGEAVQIMSMRIHPKYNKIVVDVNGKKPTNSPDVATMRLEEPVGEPLSVANKATLEKLTPGQPVYYVGFPMENLEGDNVNLHNVVATTQTGTISALSDWWLGDSGCKKNKLIRHNMGIAGGASGSPVFNEEGQVIGLVNAGNMIGAVFSYNGKSKIERSPNAALINYAVRVDLLNDFK